MNTTGELVDEIRKNPRNFIPQPRIMNLRSFINGWISGKEENFSEKKLIDRFNKWLNKKFEIRPSQSWEKVIFYYSSGELDAFKQFFELFDEFNNRVSKK